MHLCVKTLYLYPIDTLQARSFKCLIGVYSNETCTAMLTNGYPPFSDDLRVEIENYAVS